MFVNKMVGRPKIFDETLALEKAVELFWTKGYEATSTDDLIKAMGIQRGSFYNTFQSKKALYMQAIDHHERKTFHLFRQLIREGDEPLEVVKQVLLDLADCPPEEHQRGCFAGNTLAELTGIDPELTDCAKQHLIELEEIFFKVIIEARQSGHLKSPISDRLLSRHLLNLWNGINITRRIYQTPLELREVINLQLQILK